MLKHRSSSLWHRFSGLLTVLVGLAAIGAAKAQDLEFVMMTAPPQPVAGEPWSLVFAARTLEGIDRDTATVPTVEVASDRLLVRPRAECRDAFCDVDVSNVFRVDMPPLAAGTYTVEVVSGSDTEYASADPFEITVGSGPMPESLRPVDGFWNEPEKPGRGLALQLRGMTVGLGAYDMQPVFDQFEPV